MEDVIKWGIHKLCTFYNTYPELTTNQKLFQINYEGPKKFTDNYSKIFGKILLIDLKSFKKSSGQPGKRHDWSANAMWKGILNFFDFEAKHCRALSQIRERQSGLNLYVHMIENMINSFLITLVQSYTGSKIGELSLIHRFC